MTDTNKARRAAFRNLADGLEKVDLPVYTRYGKDPLEPIIGQGDRRARVAVFGRDPGRDEVRHGIPFIGAGGQKVRAVLHQVLHGAPLPDFEASVAVGKYIYWANTVPYKPAGNKAWSQKIKKQFRPLMAEVLIHDWQGEDVLTLGREAFFWFGIDAPKPIAQALASHWAREDRFTTSLEIEFTAPENRSRMLRLHPLPHPSPLNAVWYKRFSGLLEARLLDLDFSLAHWKN